MRSTTHPEGIKEVNAIKITQEVKDFVSETSKDVESERTGRAQWETKIDELIDLRYGYRQKKTFPWRDAANNSIPLIDFHISQAKPDYVNLAYGATPIVGYESFGAEDVKAAKKREVLFDWRMRTKVRMFKQYCIGVDKALEQGAIIFKVEWDYSTRNYKDEFDLEDYDDKVVKALNDNRTNDGMLFQIIVEEMGIDVDFEENIEEIKKVIEEFRAGETKFEFDLLEVVKNQPKVTACSLRHEVMIPKDTLELQDARFIDQPFWRTTNQVKIAMKDEKYIEFDDNIIKAWAKSDSKRQSLSKAQDENILFHETCVWYDINGDGIKERCIATWPDSTPTDVLRFIEVPYDHGLFPYTLVKRELNDKGLYTSRGLAALDEDFQKAITNAINQSENNGTMANPVVVMRKNTVTNIKSRRYIPMETVETSGPPEDYQIRQFQNVSQPILDQSAQYLKNWADGRVGNLSQGLSEISNLPGSGSGGKKTAKEVDLISSLGGKVPSLDMQIWQDQMADVYYQIDALYEQFGDEEEEVIITGEKPQKITRRETQGKWNIVPSGKLDTTNPILKANKAFNLMKIFVGDPDIKQYELKKAFLIDYDPNIAKTILYSKEDKERMQQMQAQVIEEFKQKAKQEGIEDRQTEILLEVWKEKMLEPIIGKKFAPG